MNSRTIKEVEREVLTSIAGRLKVEDGLLPKSITTDEFLGGRSYSLVEIGDSFPHPPHWRSDLYSTGLQKLLDRTDKAAQKKYYKITFLCAEMEETPELKELLLAWFVRFVADEERSTPYLCMSKVYSTGKLERISFAVERHGDTIYIFKFYKSLIQVNGGLVGYIKLVEGGASHEFYSCSSETDMVKLYNPTPALPMLAVKLLELYRNMSFDQRYMLGDRGMFANMVQGGFYRAYQAQNHARKVFDTYKTNSKEDFSVLLATPVSSPSITLSTNGVPVEHAANREPFLAHTPCDATNDILWLAWICSNLVGACTEVLSAPPEVWENGWGDEHGNFLELELGYTNRLLLPKRDAVSELLSSFPLLTDIVVEEVNATISNALGDAFGAWKGGADLETGGQSSFAGGYASPTEVYNTIVDLMEG